MIQNCIRLLACLSVLVCVACNGEIPAEQSGHKETQSSQPDATQQDQQAAVTERDSDALLRLISTPWQGDLDGMLERGMIRVLVVHSRTHYFDVEGKQKGISYELLTRFQDWLNDKYPPSVKHIKTNVFFIPVSRDKLVTALQQGRGDIAVAAITATPERRQAVDFSEPFFRDINEILVTGNESPEISSLEDLSGKRLFVRESSSYWEHLQRLNRQFNEQGLDPVKLVAAPEQLQDEDLMEMLNAGLTEMLVVDDYKAVLWSSVFPNLKLHHDIPINTGGETAWMFRKDSPLLESAINEFAETHKQGTLLGNVLVSRYVDKSRFIKNALSPGETERFRKVVELFRQYGDQYDLNHLLLMAQAYQESGLNQEVKSHVGAIGIMQLMPATGKQMNVGDIRQLEPNIHAGVKYIRHIIDHYLRDEPMDELNMTLFAFAAYNAGPNRINKLRQAAKEADLDPNLWFNNVEVLAARKIGSETVTYVANIFKYYVAFKLVQEEEAEKSRAKESLQSAR